MGFSIDDIYKSQEERRLLSEEVHPLCYVRGVPGTHDITMGLDLIEQLSNADHDTETSFPILDKPAKACRGPTRQTCCGADVTKQCGCATCHSCPTTIKIDRRGRPWSTKKMRACLLYTSPSPRD